MNIPFEIQMDEKERSRAFKKYSGPKCQGCKQALVDTHLYGKELCFSCRAEKIENDRQRWGEPKNAWVRHE